MVSPSYHWFDGDGMVTLQRRVRLSRRTVHDICADDLPASLLMQPRRDLHGTRPPHARDRDRQELQQGQDGAADAAHGTPRVRPAHEPLP